MMMIVDLVHMLTLIVQLFLGEQLLLSTLSPGFQSSSATGSFGLLIVVVGFIGVRCTKFKEDKNCNSKIRSMKSHKQ